MIKFIKEEVHCEKLVRVLVYGWCKIYFDTAEYLVTEKIIPKIKKTPEKAQLPIMLTKIITRNLNNALNDLNFCSKTLGKNERHFGQDTELLYCRKFLITKKIIDRKYNILKPENELTEKEKQWIKELNYCWITYSKIFVTRDNNKISCLPEDMKIKKKIEPQKRASLQVPAELHELMTFLKPYVKIKLNDMVTTAICKYARELAINEPEITRNTRIEELLSLLEQK